MEHVKKQKIFRNLFLVGVMVLWSGLSFANQKKIDSLFSELSSTKDSREICRIHFRLAANYKVIDTEKGLYYAKKAKKESAELHWGKGLAHSYYETGSIYRITANYPESLKHLFKALKYSEDIKDYRLIGLSLSELAIVYRHTNNLGKSIYYAKRALTYNQKVGNIGAQVQNYNELAIANVLSGNQKGALEYFKLSYQLCMSSGQLRNAAVIIGNKGIVYRDLKQWKKAIEAYERSSEIHSEMNFELGVALAHQNIGDVYLRYYQDTTDSEKLDIPKSLILDSAENRMKKTFSGFEKYDDLSDLKGTYQLLADIYELKYDYKNAFINFKKFKALKDSIDSNDNKVKVAKLGEERAEYEKKQQVKITKQQERLTELSENKRSNETIGFIVGFVVLLTFTIFIFRERRKSDRLLLNILPESVAAELKKKGSSEAQLFGDVTVLFTDFVGFTTVSERLTPKQLVDELDTCFRVFDQIMARHNIEKIKTVGDAYLAVCGLPENNPRHAQNVINAGMDIVRFMNERKKIIGDNTFEIRVGIHTGNVVAGIVGVKKFAYDIWGDTVNTAARMEQNSEPGKINISSSTYELVKDEFECKYRGEISAKNKGQLAMYFIEGEKC